ncbi:AMP-dependent synthetase/ligase [Galactobacter caseinivorans]|uniref:Acyl-CoA synthetase n=1 Tax=Galactobacter caseinivorans TaxID=2676123 RepID=A0A496PJP3_9MICC|nr:long-chain fatty acid--CoA ligase [Galactobacter caseinivorans]RKW70640.1 long-chain fatty acid--CoA ligase [Galactobacter caseinivorans]
MQEYSAALEVDLPPHFNTTQLLLDRDAAALPYPLYLVQHHHTGEWVEVDTSTYIDLVRSLARALVADGLREGETVAIMSHTCFEWALLEQAIWFAGGISVPIYETSSVFQVRWILEDSGARRVFVENAACAAVVGRAASELGAAVKVMRIDEAPADAVPDSTPVPMAPGVSSLVASGRESGVPPVEIESRRAKPGLSDPASVVYTSGTVGQPKGCIITHANFSLVAANLKVSMAEVVPAGSRTAIFLPLAHVLARAVQHACVHTGTVVAHTSPGRVTVDLPAIKPTWLLAVPRIYEKLQAGALNSAEADGKGAIFRRAAAVATQRGRDDDAAARGEKVPRRPLQAAQYALFNKLVYPKIRAVMGGEAAWSISGASALNPDLAYFFNGVGLGVLEGYGLTETTAPALVNRPGHARVGTVGQPIPGTTVRIAEDGEILLKGIGIFGGYWHRADATAQAFNEDGFFLTGDLGELDSEGYLRVTGRKKDLIVTAGGKNVSPAPLEEVVKAGRIVSQCVVVGDDKPFVGALITLDPEELDPWAKANGLPTGLSSAAAAKDPRVLEEVQTYVDAANRTVSRAEGIRKFVILPQDFTEADGHVTPSMKLRRKAVIESFSEAIDSLYTR